MYVSRHCSVLFSRHYFIFISSHSSNTWIKSLHMLAGTCLLVRSGCQGIKSTSLLWCSSKLTFSFCIYWQTSQDLWGIKLIFCTDRLPTEQWSWSSKQPPTPTLLSGTHASDSACQMPSPWLQPFPWNWVVAADFPGLSRQQQEMQLPRLYSRFRSRRRRHVRINMHETHKP